jgi:DNA-binding transcriptional ArsR family regulator
LANKKRLAILAELMARPEQSVTAVAGRLRLPLPVASQYLRHLNARGFLSPRRMGSQVVYRPLADRSVPHAHGLLNAIRACMQERKDAIPFIFRHVTAFTHPRRVAVVAALGNGASRVCDLGRATGISLRALHRHLRKLTDRGYLCPTADGVALARPADRLAAALLQQARTRNT